MCHSVSMRDQVNRWLQRSTVFAHVLSTSPKTNTNNAKFILMEYHNPLCIWLEINKNTYMATWSNEWLMVTLICVISNDTPDILHYLIMCKHSGVTSLSTVTNATFVKLRTFQQHPQKHLIEYFSKLYQMLPWLSSEMILIYKIDC